MKKILLFFAAMCCMMAAKAENPNATKIGNFYYILDKTNHTATVTWGGSYDWDGTSDYIGSITIPSCVDYEDTQYSVTSIGECAFAYCELSSVVIPQSVTCIEDQAFYKCQYLKNITLPEGLVSIGEEAFHGCEYLTSVTLPSSVTVIGDNAFESCIGLTSITLPEGLESIGKAAFGYCEKLTSITLPSSVTSIGEYPFSGCLYLSSMSVDEGNTVYDSRNNCNAIIEKVTNTLVAGCKNTVIPSSVMAIGDNAFYDINTLTSITIPSSVTSIGECAFYACGITSIAIPSSVTSIGISAFENCEDLTSVTLPSSITSIEEWTFSYCNSLTSFTIPYSVTSVGSSAFEYCDKLASVTIPSSVTSIGSYAFAFCPSLASSTLPSSITTIEECAFWKCGLESLTVLASTPPSLGKDVFKGDNMSIPVYVTNVTTYSNESWGGFTNFQAINIDDYKQAAIAEINAAKKGVSLSEEDVIAINGYINTIMGVTTISVENLATIENAKKDAFAVISQATMKPAREAALAAIEAAMQGETGTYITGLAQQYINIINAATDVTTINNARNTALVALNAAVAAYKAGKGDAIGSLGEKQNGPAVEVIDQDDNSIILYNPKKVNFIKVTSNE